MAGGLTGWLMELEDAPNRRAMEKRQMEFKETYEAPYMEAMTNYQNALADEKAKDLLDDSDRQLRAAQGMLTKQQAKQLKQQYNVYSEGLASNDPAERAAARNAILGIDASKALAGQLDQMNTQLNISKVMIDIMAELRMQDAQKRNVLESNLNLLMGSPETGKAIYGTKTFSDMLARRFGEAAGEEVSPTPGGEKGGFFGPRTGTHQVKKGDAGQVSQNPELEAMLNKINNLDVTALGMSK